MIYQFLKEKKRASIALPIDTITGKKNQMTRRNDRQSVLFVLPRLYNFFRGFSFFFFLLPSGPLSKIIASVEEEGQKL